MAASSQSWHKYPSVTAALMWLLPPTLSATDRTVYRLARLLRLIRKSGPDEWKVNGSVVSRLVKSSLRRLPNDPQQLGNILHGLGEIAARSHVTIIDPLIAHLGRRRHLQLGNVLAAALAQETPKKYMPKVETIAFVQWLCGTHTISWDSLKLAISYVKSEHMRLRGGRYGLVFTVRVVLSLDVRAVEDYIRANINNESLEAIGNAAFAMVFPFEGKARLVPLLQSHNAALRSIGVAAFISPLEIMGAPLGLHDCHEALVANGIEPSDATWMVGVRIKEAIHQRYYLEHAQKTNTARLRYVEKNPEDAMGGARNADAELQMLRSQLKAYMVSYSQLLLELEGMLTDLAEDWPENGLTNEQMEWLDNIFVNTAEFRHRLAEKLPHGSSRDWLLRRNILQIQNFIGLDKSAEDVSTGYFSPDKHQLFPLTEWAAQSLCLLYSQDKKGIGKQTSYLVQGVAVVATKILQQPFFSARKPEAWQAILTRAACAYHFALMVVVTTPRANHDKVAILNEHAIDYSFAVLSHGHLPVQTAWTFFELTTLAVHNMRDLSQSDDVREKWALAETLPDFARALALWSSSPLVTKHNSLASDLFCRVGSVPLSQRGLNLQMTQMLRLLDIAVFSCATNARDDLISQVISLWNTAYKPWQAINDTWADSATMLASAIKEDGVDRARLRSDESFDRSYCAQLINVDQS